jgi:hypothetical protein
MQVNPDLYFFALDFSPRAIAFVKVFPSLLVMDAGAAL